MDQLKPAGILSSLASFFFPKQLEVELRTDTLPNGQVEITPHFYIDGKEVPSEMVGECVSQNVMGYSVAMGPQVLQVQQQTKGRPTRMQKRRAAEYLNQLDKSGIKIRSKDGKSRPRIEQAKPDISLELGADDSLKIKSEVITPQGVVLEKAPSLEKLMEESGWYSVGADLVQVDITGTPLDQVLLTEQGSEILLEEDVPQFLKLLKQQAGHIGFVEKSDNLKNLDVLSKTPELRAKVDGTSDSISIMPSLAYSGNQGQQYELPPPEVKSIKEKKSRFKRVADGWLEISEQATDKFEMAFEQLTEKVGQLEDIRGSAIPNVLSEIKNETRKANRSASPWSVYFSEAIRNSHRIIDDPANVHFRMNIVESDGKSLLALDPIYNHERFKLSHADVEEAASENEGWIRRPNAWIKADQEKFNRIEEEISRLKLQRSSQGFAFPASQRENVLRVFSVLGSIEHSEAYSIFLLKLADFEKIEDVPLPSNLRADIQFRPYQKHGFNWLAFLQRFGLNGILADDMGLGKTLQTLAAIQRAREMSQSPRPSLIICPTSVVSNWKSEVNKFFHDCPVVIYAGVERGSVLRHIADALTRQEGRAAGAIVITSYDVARLDQDVLGMLPWLYVVVDEGHNIKNPDAKRTKAIKTINGQHKLALTGTPIQNNLEELWSLFDYAMPGYLGSRSEFKSAYGKNGRINWDAVRNDPGSLKERIHPFILRRLKENVAKDLPTKDVVDCLVELTSRQTEIYKKVLGGRECEAMRADVDKKGVAQSRLSILAALSKLRLVCNHPILVESDDQASEFDPSDSGKLCYLKDLIEEAVAGEHRTLLFSQSTKMLDIIEKCFRDWEIKAIRLDGETPQQTRATLVDDFNQDTSIHCFLISTKAGGTGLNLTGADTVIFYDHDWNPAHDKQAQDRAYRIGQTKPVTIYRLISKGTIEEQILLRQARKQSMADEIIDTDDAGFKELTKDELLSLFKLDSSERHGEALQE